MSVSASRQNHDRTSPSPGDVRRYSFVVNDQDPLWPNPISSSQPITHLKSTFQAHATSSSSPDPKALSDFFSQVVHLYPRTKRASHCMYAWRSRVSRPPTKAAQPSQSKGRSSTPMNSDKPAPTFDSGSSDGGEAGAGERLSRLLELSQSQDVIVVVYRWYGGVQLGSDRWKCISSVAKEALEAGGFLRKGDQGMKEDGVGGSSQKSEKSRGKRKKR